MSGEPDKIQWGILGCARVAQQVLAPGIQNSKNGTILAIASRSLDTARAFAATFHIERAYGSYDELLDDGDIEAVYIPLPNSLHWEWTIKAASKGKHVLCEKPLSCTAREAEEMAEACSRHRVLLMEAFAHRFMPQNLQVKKLLDGGILMDKGCYCVNTARFIFGAEPISVYATAEFGAASGVDESMTATLEFAGGRVAHFDCRFSLSEQTYCQSYEVFGQSGHIYVPHGFSRVETYRYGTIVGTSFFVGDDAVANPSLERIECPGVHSWQLEAEYFADAILNGEGLRLPAENGLANMKVMDALYKSAREGRTAEL